VVKTLTRMAALAALLALTNCGVFGAKGNDSGGIIPWSPAAEQAAMETAQAHCGAFGKYALITSVHREPGDYIAYSCTWKPARQIYRQYR
jgi:hypothetical protein